MHSSTMDKTLQATTIPCSNCNNTWPHKKHFIVVLPKIDIPELTNPTTTTPNRNAHHTTTAVTLKKHTKGPLANAFIQTNTTMETNMPHAQINLLITTLQTITPSAQLQPTMDKILTTIDGSDTSKTIIPNSPWFHLQGAPLATVPTTCITPMTTTTNQIKMIMRSTNTIMTLKTITTRNKPRIKMKTSQHMNQQISLMTNLLTKTTNTIMVRNFLQQTTDPIKKQKSTRLIPMTALLTKKI